MKAVARPKPSGRPISKGLKNKVVKKKVKDSVVGKKVLELAAETLPTPDKKKLAKSLLKKKKIASKLKAKVAPKGKKIAAPAFPASVDLNRDLLDGACSNILKLIQDQEKAKSGKQLFNTDAQEIYLQVQLFKVPITPYNHVRCVVPHPIYSQEPEVCLIVPDLFRGRRSDAMFAQMKATMEDRMKSTKVTKIKMLLPFTLLRSEYHQLEMKRRLNNSYDVFLCDGRILAHCSKFFGKAINKPIIPIRAIERKKIKPKKDQKQKDIVHFNPFLKSEVDKALQKVNFVVSPHGVSVSIRHVGHSELTSEQLADNITAVWGALEKDLPGGVKNIHSAYVKGPASAALPFFVSFNPPEEVPVGKFREVAEVVEDELSTMPGRRVTVQPNGDIIIRDDPSGEDLDFIQKILKTDVENMKKRKYDAKARDDDKADADGDADTDSVGSKNSGVSDNKTVDPGSKLKLTKDVNVKKQMVKKKEEADDDESDDDDEDDDFMEAAEDSYLMDWSQSQSMKELEGEAKEKSKKKKTGRPNKKPAAKQTAQVKKTSPNVPKESPKVQKKVSNAPQKNVKGAPKKNVKGAPKKNVQGAPKSKNVNSNSKKNVNKGSKSSFNKFSKKKA